MELLAALSRSPVIAAVRGQAELARAVRSSARVVFLLGGDLFVLPSWVQAVREAGKIPFVHVDLVEGIGRDVAGVHVISRMVKPSGVISTRAPLLRAAADEELLTVLRIFLVDSSSMETGARMVKMAAPSLVEIMPGVATRAIARIRERIETPIIAGGMISDAADVSLARQSGALAVSTSCERLWASEEGL